VEKVLDRHLLSARVDAEERVARFARIAEASEEAPAAKAFLGVLASKQKYGLLKEIFFIVPARFPALCCAGVL
jgi:hypothetical protein